MKNINATIESGILELYVLGIASDAEIAEVESQRQLHPEIEQEIEKISASLLTIEAANTSPATRLNPDLKIFLMATIDYAERLKNGEKPTVPPVLNDLSKPIDFEAWTSREDLFFDESYGAGYAKIIGYTPQAITAIVWLKEGSPEETHEKEFEKFLILEGSCLIITSTKVYSLAAGDFFEIPLHLSHSVEVTSATPCKLILQRVAA